MNHLTDVQKHSYREQGYLIVKAPYLLALKKKIREDLKAIVLNLIERKGKFASFLPELQEKKFQQVFDWAVTHLQERELSRSMYEVFPTVPSVIHLLNDPNLLMLTSELDIRFSLASTLPTLRIDRAADTRWSTPAHQDFWFSMLSSNCVTYWFPMVPLSEEMGPLWIIPGSQKNGVLPIKPWTKENPFTTQQDFPDDQFTPVVLEEDEVLAFQQCPAHKSGFNRSPRAQLTLQMRYNDLHTLEQPTASFVVTHSRYVREAQEKLLNQGHAN